MQDIIKIVQRNLWSRGYRVKSLNREIFGFDLLVEDKFKVVVIKVASVNQAPKEVTDEKIIAAVMTKTFGNPLIAYFAKGVTSNVPRSVFGLASVKNKKNERKKEKNKKVEEVGKEGIAGNEAAKS